MISKKSLTSKRYKKTTKKSNSKRQINNYRPLTIDWIRKHIWNAKTRNFKPIKIFSKTSSNNSNSNQNIADNIYIFIPDGNLEETWGNKKIKDWLKTDKLIPTDMHFPCISGQVKYSSRNDYEKACLTVCSKNKSNKNTNSPLSFSCTNGYAWINQT